MEISENDLEVFITAAERFFTVTTGDPVQCGDARIHFSLPPLLDYTGWIVVSGLASGIVCVTASRDTLGGMLESLGEHPEDDELMADLVGELAGTLVMNAREHFGEHLNVSTPQVYSTGNRPEPPGNVA
ncbi:MAG: chemotaxis protein CheX, partial [Gammaproteobacteria bacterium]